MRDPLVKDRSAVDEDKRVPATRGRHVRPEDSLPYSRRSDEDSDVVLEQSVRRLVLNGGEIASKLSLQLLAPVSCVFDRERDTVLPEQFFNLGLATSRKGDMLLEVLGARDDARRHGGR